MTSAGCAEMCDGLWYFPFDCDCCLKSIFQIILDKLGFAEE